MLRSLDPTNGYKPKDRKDMSKGELEYLERAAKRDRELQITAELRQMQIEEAEQRRAAKVKK